MSNPPLNPSKDPKGRAYQGKKCSKNSECSNNEKCAYPGDDHLSKICCPQGAYHKEALGHYYCKNLPDGYYCASGGGCETGHCGHPEGNASIQTICCWEGKISKWGGRDYCSDQAGGAGCINDSQCSSNHCLNGVCTAPLSSLGQYKKDVVIENSLPKKIQNVIIWGIIAIVAVIIVVLIFKYA